MLSGVNQKERENRNRARHGRWEDVEEESWEGKRSKQDWAESVSGGKSETATQRDRRQWNPGCRNILLGWKQQCLEVGSWWKIKGGRKGMRSDVMERGKAGLGYILSGILSRKSISSQGSDHLFLQLSVATGCSLATASGFSFPFLSLQCPLNPQF